MPLSGFHPDSTKQGAASAAVANVVMDAIENGDGSGTLYIHDLPTAAIDRLARRLAAAGWEVQEVVGKNRSYVAVQASKDDFSISLFRSMDR